MLTAEKSLGAFKNKLSRRKFVEKISLLGGGLAIIASKVDSIGSSSYVSDQVDEEMPYLLTDRARRGLPNTLNRFAKIGAKTSEQQQVLNQVQSVVEYDTVNEANRKARADQLQQESDQTPIFGVERNHLRWGALVAGIGAVAAGFGSKIARAYGK